MPVIATGIVVEWKVADRNKKDARVQFESCSDPITVYVAGGDEVEMAVASAIMSKYILKLADNDKKTALEKASEGLLQVVVIGQNPVRPPPLP